MSSNNSTDTVSFFANKKSDQIVFSVLVLLALIGVVVTNISPVNAHGFWVLMLVVYACTATYYGRNSASSLDGGLGGFVGKQVIHWGGSLTAVLCVYALVRTGTVNYEQAGTMILLILALATFLAGSHVGWRFYILGAFLALITVIMAYVERYLWLIVVIVCLILGAVYLWTRYKSSRSI